MTLYEAVFDSVNMIFLLSIPAILTAIAAGFFVGLFQALTSIQDQTLPQGIKVILVIIALAMTATFMTETMLEYTNNLFVNFPLLR